MHAPPPFDLNRRLGPFYHDYDRRATTLYALSVGATIEDLEQLDSDAGPSVLPSYVVLPAFEVSSAIGAALQQDAREVLHTRQVVRWHRRLPPSGRLVSDGKIAAVYDLTTAVELILTTRTHDESGRLLAETEWTLFSARGAGFGGPPPPDRPTVIVPPRPADFSLSEPIPATQAHLYALNGDQNPIHTSAAQARARGFERPILHGLCTFGYVTRALTRMGHCRNLGRLELLGGDFRSPVYPGEELTIDAWLAETGVIVTATARGSKARKVFSKALASYCRD